MKPVKVLIVGGGSRGTGYGSYIADHAADAQVVGVAEPRDFYRDRIAEQHKIPPANVFTDWRGAAERERFADAVFVCTPDARHAEPAVAFAKRGYHLLLEKPMAPTEADCRKIVAAATESGIVFAVCHVMRYTVYTQKLKSLLDAGLIGEVLSVQHFEPVGYWHQAHSFVRGNWGNEAKSACMLLAKSCHDLDWLRYVMGAPCLRVSSFGALSHFDKAHQPPGAADRCLDCHVESTCPYSAKKIYLGRVAEGRTGWPVEVLTPDPTAESVTEALRTGPYGRCVYACDNDVVDHQVVNMEFAGAKTATFTMTAFCQAGHRKTRIFGTRGEIYGDGRTITVFDFLTDETTTIDTVGSDASILGGHGGGDYLLMQSFLAALGEDDPSRILSGAEETLETHRMVFAAEEARRNGTVVTV